MNSRFNNTIWKVIFTIPFLYTIMPIVSRFISTYFTTYTYMFIVVLIAVGIVLSNGVASLNKYCGGILLPFILFNLLTLCNRSESIVLWGYSFLLSLVPIILGYYIVYNRKKEITYYKNTIFIAFVITILTTSIGLIRNPYAARVLATIESSNDANSILYTWQNIGGYEFIYMVVLLYPLLILAYKRKKIGLMPTLICVGSIFIMTILSEYTTAFLLLLITSVLFFLKRDLSTKDVLIFMFLAIFCMIFLDDMISNFLQWIGTLTGSETMLERLNALAGGKTGLEQSESNRIFLYERSIRTFLSNPLFGTMFKGGGGTGGHSFILDTIATYGVLGVILLYFMYRKIYRLFFVPFQNKDGYGYILWLFLQAILLSFVNTGMWVSIIALFAPICLCKIYDDGKMSYENSVDY